MTNPMHIEIASIDERLHDAVLDLRVTAEQDTWVGTPANLLAAAQASPTAEAMAVVADGEVVGAYWLEHCARALCAQHLDAPAVALLGYRIDWRHQRRGLGTRALAAMGEDLRRRHPRLALVALHVGCANADAIRVYRRAGFRDSGPPRAGGSGGPEQLMLLDLEARHP
jgi:RimJ/RimL family protein N-acetyltransferase